MANDISTPAPPEPRGSAALTAQARYEACAWAIVRRQARDQPAPAAEQAATAAEAQCQAERTELRTMLLFEYRLQKDHAAFADRQVAITRGRLIEALSRHLQSPS
ncbi:hypothetical protein BH11PSE8_BH11PSE8_40330 [soil metagenome]